MKESGIGRENGIEALEACMLLLTSMLLTGTDSQSKSTIVNIAPTEESREKDDWFADISEARYG